MRGETDYVRRLRAAVESADRVNRKKATRARAALPEPEPLEPAEPIATPKKTYGPEYQAKLAAGRLKAAREGYHVSGPVPFGYERPPKRRPYGRASVLVPHPETAPIVTAIFAQYVRLRSMKRVTAWLWAEHGVQMSSPRLAWILANPVYVGRVRFGSVEARGKHEAIVPAILWNKTQQLLAWNVKDVTKKGARPKWVKGGEARPRMGVALCSVVFEGKPCPSVSRNVGMCNRHYLQVRRKGQVVS